MAEKSMLWTTGGAGDGSAAYTQDEATRLFRSLVGGDPAYNYVLPGVDNELQVTGSSSPVSINTGAAFVYGFFYWNDSIVTKTIPTPVIGTTGHRIILRADFAARTVRIAVLSSNDGVATPPALTQTPGSIYEVSLATLTITTGGVITLIDTRGFLYMATKVGTSMLDNSAVTEQKLANLAVSNTKIVPGAVDSGSLATGAVTAGKIADGAVDTTARLANDIVDDSKLGSRVAQLSRRQGGNATHWGGSVGAGTTNYTPGAIKEYVGKITVTIPNGQTKGSVTITFPTAFSAYPIVFVSLEPNTEPTALSSAYVSSVSASGATIKIWRNGTGTGSDEDLQVVWRAVGPE